MVIFNYGIMGNLKFQLNAKVKGLHCHKIRQYIYISINHSHFEDAPTMGRKSVTAHSLVKMCAITHFNCCTKSIW